MMYPYIILADETEIVHSHVFEENGSQCVEVHFERPSEDGFDTARCSLPSYTWIKHEGFTDMEIEKFNRFLIGLIIYKFGEDTEYNFFSIYKEICSFFRQK